jgi:hypothetical protein
MKHLTVLKVTFERKNGADTRLKGSSNNNSSYKYHK